MAKTHLYDGETFEHKGYTFRVEFQHDQDNGAPWDECDGHGIVSDWTRRQKAPGERLLAESRGSFRYYDIAETIKIARRDKWGPATEIAGESARARAARAVNEDYEYLRLWCSDQWQYLGVIVTHVEFDDDDNEVDTDLSESLWGVESYKDYHMTVAYELADELVARLEVDEPLVVLGEN